MENPPSPHRVIPFPQELHLPEICQITLWIFMPKQYQEIIIQGISIKTPGPWIGTLQITLLSLMWS